MNIKTISVLMVAAASLLGAAIAVAADTPSIPPAAKPIYDDYMKIQTALAGDSMDGVAEHANAIADRARADETKSLPPALAKQAELLALTRNVVAAREAFKPLSDSLIKYLAGQKIRGNAYYEVYCPMAQASWLQTNKVVSNPYMGKEMSTCGVFKN